MRSGSRRGGIISGLLFVFLGLLVAAGIAAFVFVHNVRITHDYRHGDSVKIETPFATVRVGEKAKADPRVLGIPVYPGAEPVNDKRTLATIELDWGDEHKEFGLLAAKYATNDSATKVRDFYEQQLPSWTFVKRHHGAWEIHQVDGGCKRIIGISERNGRTYIALASVGEPAAN